MRLLDFTRKKYNNFVGFDVDDKQFDDVNNGEHDRTARDDVVPLVGSIPEYASTA